ncbi:hypothetical protein AAFF_G00091800 [Aldrovandia affinis]|uniref:Secreted protein n=1 Tax=Aldrovandia affinis TaxID=143900 RepID=A0AAD7T2G1_9TELE|nr:hypothetical protein AAFF_G00091800 [Aldrovandia affinis]
MSPEGGHHAAVYSVLFFSTLVLCTEPGYPTKTLRNLPRLSQPACIWTVGAGVHDVGTRVMTPLPSRDMQTC